MIEPRGKVGAMKRTAGCLLGLCLCLGSNAYAVQMSYPVKDRIAILQDGDLRHKVRHTPRVFRLEVLSDDKGRMTETAKAGRPFITAHPGERYSLRLTNPLPVRVAVNLTVDGLNSISGKPSGISDGQKWMIEPYSSITIPGWQVNGGEARRFFFTDKPKSYAQWREDMTGRELSSNCGVIGAAFFWNQAELDRYYDEHPLIRTSARRNGTCASESKKSGNFGACAPACAKMESADKSQAEEGEQQAGTGMGERESHPTVQVAFDYDTGMYKLSQALLVYYDFAKSVSPNPFPGPDYAPEMN